MIFLISFCTAPMVPDTKAVIPPQIAIKTSTRGAYSSTGEQRINKNTPAVTIVAACIRADTGVGPSIASGSQVCRPTCADLPTAPTSINAAMISSRSLGR